LPITLLIMIWQPTMAAGSGVLLREQMHNPISAFLTPLSNPASSIQRVLSSVPICPNWPACRSAISINLGRCPLKYKWPQHASLARIIPLRSWITVLQEKGLWRLLAQNASLKGEPDCAKRPFIHTKRQKESIIFVSCTKPFNMSIELTANGASTKKKVPSSISTLV